MSKGCKKIFWDSTRGGCWTFALPGINDFCFGQDFPGITGFSGSAVSFTKETAVL